MTEPQLSVRSAKAKELAHALARRTGMPMSKLVEQALERYDQELRQRASRCPMDAVWDLAAEDRRAIPLGTTSVHDEYYDEHGVPR